MKIDLIPAAALAAVLPLSPAAAQSTAVSSDAVSPDQAAHKDAPPAAIVITGRKLDLARDAIAPSLGASQYTFDREALNKQPGGTNLTLNKSLLQAPGVTQDSYGTIHVRNEHANLQYRLNGVIVPESISGFGTTFDPKIASSIQLITGTLPAQYGYRTAGVVNFKTESGLLGNGGEAGIYGGSYGWLEPSVMVKGSTGNFSYFLSGSYLRNNLGIENPLPTRYAIHDRTTQWRPFAYVSDVLSDFSRISVFGGSFIGISKFRMSRAWSTASTSMAVQLRRRQARPEPEGNHPLRRRCLSICRRQAEPSGRAIHPLFATKFSPDPNEGDIIVNGFADAAKLTSLAAGVQADGSSRLGADHTVRFGLFFQNEHTTSDIVSTVLPRRRERRPDKRRALCDHRQACKTGRLYGAYLQDEWKLTPKLTLNYGARFDIVVPIPGSRSSARAPTWCGRRLLSPPCTSATPAISPRRRRNWWLRPPLRCSTARPRNRRSRPAIR